LTANRPQTFSHLFADFQPPQTRIRSASATHSQSRIFKKTLLTSDSACPRSRCTNSTMPKALRVVGKYSLGLILILLPGRVYCQSATPLPPAPSAAAQTQRKPDNQKEKPQHSPAAATGSPGHIFWVVPAYKVDYQHGFKPLTQQTSCF